MSLQRLAVPAYRMALIAFLPRSSTVEREEIVQCFEDAVVHRRADSRVAAATYVARSFASLPKALLLTIFQSFELTKSDAAERPGMPVQPTNRHSAQQETTMSGLMSDFKFAARGLARRPVFAGLALLSLALGIGANASILGMVDAVLWRTLPVPDVEQVVRVFQTDERGHRRLSYANYRLLADQPDTALDGIMAHRLQTFGLGVNDRVSVVHGELVSGTYFDVLQVEAQQGRTFTAAETAHTGAAPVVVLSHDLWVREFDQDPNIVGTIVRLNDHSFQVFGIAEASFNGTKFGLGMDLWVPIWAWADAEQWTEGWNEQASGSSWLAVARLSSDLSLRNAEPAFEPLAARLRDAHPEANRDLRLSLFGEVEGGISPHAAGIPKLIGTLALAGSALVLFVACGNVASLLFAKAIGRRHEMAIRYAMGVRRARLIRQLLVESVLLAMLGGALGLAAAWMTSGVLSTLTPNLPYRFAVDASPDFSVALICALIALSSALVFGLAPALQASAVDPASALGSARTLSSRRGQRGLSVVVVCMVAFSLASLVTTGLLLRSLDAVRDVAPGFEPAGRVVAEFDVSLAGDPNLDVPGFFDALRSKVAEWPGVEASAVSSLIPLGDRAASAQLFAHEDGLTYEDKGTESWRASISPGYFAAIGTELTVGRDFGLHDQANGEPVVIVNSELAELLWPKESAIGKLVRFQQSADAQTFRVVGVAANSRYLFLNEPPRPAIFRPLAQSPRGQAVLIANTQHTAGLLEALPEIFSAIDPRVPVIDGKTMDEHVESSLWMFKLGAKLAGGLGLMALVLSAAGLYGVMAHAVSQRRFEFGVRAALGATQQKLVTMMLSRGLRLSLVGAALGVGIALALGSAMGSVLYGVSSTDPVSMAAGVLALAVVVLLAVLLPSLRAARLDPSTTLKP